MRPILAIVVALVACGPSRAAVSQGPDDDWRRRAEQRIRPRVEEITGPVEEPCGFRWLPARTALTAENFFPKPRQRDVAAAVSCVTTAQRRKRATWAFWQRSGFDSWVFGGLATTPSGGILLLHYDSIAPPELTARPCPAPRPDPASNVQVSCDPR